MAVVKSEHNRIERVLFWNRVDGAVRQLERLVAVMPYWRSTLQPLNVVASTILPIITLGIWIINYSTLPAQVPFTFNQLEKINHPTDKILLPLASIFLILLNLVILRVNRNVFDFDRILANLFAATQIICNILYFIAVVQLLNLALT